ncbi:hypothetical protein F8M41_014327 [Gigaspora margarita]|uniref:Uncharacterized protein n=1 Tax=Gigaspora margarita TaxID=4874 RepID=A0A8H4ARY0_GIGMA|nr:hypothetical protein F8M41_014327 [Gigaspora margarita]
MNNNNQGMNREEAVIEETEEENTQLNAKDNKILFAQQCCFRIIFLTSTTGFIGLAFFLASSNISGTTINLLIVFLSGLIGSILLRRVFSTNTRIDRTSSIDYMLSSRKIKEKIIEMFTFEAHNYSHGFILKDVNKHSPLNSRQLEIFIVSHYIQYIYI